MNGSILGQIVSRTQPVPLAGLHVVLTCRHSPGSEKVRRCRTDGEGWFQALDLPAGRWRIQAFGAPLVTVDVFDFSTSTVTLEVMGVQTPPDRVPWDMPPCTRPQSEDRPQGDSQSVGSVAGQVFGARDGAAVSNVTVSILQGPGPTPDIALVTDEQGRFFLENLAPGLWTLQALTAHGITSHGAVMVRPGARAVLHLEVDDG